MSIFARVFDSLQQAIVLADRVEILSRSVEGMARDLRQMDRRLSRIEGALNTALGASLSPRLPPPEDPSS